MTCDVRRKVAAGILVAMAMGLSPAVGAAKSDDYQRLASHRSTPVEASVDLTVLAQPAGSPQVAVGGVELQLGLRLWDRWDLSTTGRLPVDLVARSGTPYQLTRRPDYTVRAATAYSFGPPHRRHRVGLGAETPQSYEASYVVATIRDPLVHGAGMSWEVARENGSEADWTIGVRLPLSAALVVNDVASLHVELTPGIAHVLRRPRGTLSAVVSVRWAWERAHVGSAALFGEHGAPGGMALTGGLKWKRDE
ncbi:MAG: hypothetical protein WD492_10285 [Alkalispirochaeta sp.]